MVDLKMGIIAVQFEECTVQILLQAKGADIFSGLYPTYAILRAQSHREA